MKNALTCLLLVTAATLPARLHAQVQTPVTSTLTFSSVDVAADKLYIPVDDGYLSIAPEDGNASSAPIAYKGPARFPLLLRVSEEDNAEQYLPVGDVQLPPTAARDWHILLLQHAPRQITTVAAARLSNPSNAGSIQIINVSAKPIGVLVNKESKSIQPAGAALFTRSPASNQFEVRVALQRDGQWQEVTNNIYPRTDGTHYTVFLIDRSPDNAPAHIPPEIDFFAITEHLPTSSGENSQAEIQ